MYPISFCNGNYFTLCHFGNHREKSPDCGHAALRGNFDTRPLTSQNRTQIV